MMRNYIFGSTFFDLDQEMQLVLIYFVILLTYGEDIINE